MNFRQRLALWLTHRLCPEIGASAPVQAACPDFIEDLFDDEYELVAEWAEYCARQQSTVHHLDRCLNQ